MAREESVNYIRQYRGKYPDQQIREKLAAGGCLQAEIDEAFTAAGESAAPPANFPVETPSAGNNGMVLRRVLGVPLIAISLLVLVYGGAMMAPNLSRLVISKPADFGVLLSGFIGGAIGAAMLYGGIALCRNRAAEKGRVKIWEVLLSGLCFPGAAQAYAGRWLPGALFLTFPWLLSGIMLLTFTIFHSAPDLLVTLYKAVMPSKGFYAILWILSLADGYRWAAALPGGIPQKAVPRWPAAVAGLGAITFFFLFFLMMFTVLVGGIIKIGAARAAGTATPSAQNQTAPGAGR